MSSSTSQWQIPLGLQILPAGLLGLGMLTLKESVRWLERVGRHEEAWESLKWIRADDGPAVQEERDEIRNGVTIEARATEGFRMKGKQPTSLYATVPCLLPHLGRSNLDDTK